MSIEGKICIVDNGKDYSDHSITFVRVPDGRQTELEAALAANNDARGGGRYGTLTVVALVGIEEWRDKYPPKELNEMLEELQAETDLYREDD